MLLLATPSLAANVYVSQSGGGAGTSCASPRAISSLVAGDWSPGNIIHLCGVISGALNTTILTAQGSGVSGSVITVLFESGANLTSPAWGTNGAINVSGRQWITIDGGANGIIQNTANGDQLTNRQIGTLIQANATQHVTIQNLTLANQYVAVKNVSNPLGGSAQQMNAIVISGQNNHITANTIHDCGWCIFDNYANGDTHFEIDHNNAFNWDHYIMFATAGANSATSPALLWHDDQVHDNLNWESVVPALSTLSCTYHLDGLHTFGTTGSSMDGLFIYNNYFFGSNSACTTGWIFVEGGSGTPSHVVNGFMWNNVFDSTGFDTITGLSSAGCTVANPCGPLGGLIGVFSGSSSWTVVNNTAFYINAYTSGTQGYNIGSVTNLLFKNDVSNGFVVGNNLGSLTSTPAAQVDSNFYGSACIISNNCFIFNGAFEGSFATWKSASGFDTNGAVSTFAGALMNSDGSPQTGSPLLTMTTANLTSLCSNPLLATLCSSTTKGGTISSPIARPASGSWTPGAYQFQVAGPPNPPTGLTATSVASNVNLAWTGGSGTPVATAFNVYRGTVSGGPYTIIKSAQTTASFTDSPAPGTYFYVVTGFVGGIVSSIAGNGTSATLTCTAACPLPTGTSFTVAGNSLSGFNNTFTSTGQPTSTTVTFNSSVSGTGTSGGVWAAGAESAKSNEASATSPATQTVTLLPASLTYGSFNVGSSSPSQAVTLTNTSGAGTNVTVTSIATSGDFSQTNTCPASLASGASCTINVTFTPTAAGPRSGTLTVTDSATGSPHTTSLSGTGVALVPGATLSASSVVFGAQLVSTTSGAVAVTLTSSGTGALSVSSISASGDFAIASTIPSGGICGGTMAAGATCTINITFTPTASGTRTGTLSVTDNASTSPQTASLTGTGITSKCSMTGGVTLSGAATVCGP
jgi:hypothetical protein